MWIWPTTPFVLVAPEIWWLPFYYWLFTYLHFIFLFLEIRRFNLTKNNEGVLWVKYELERVLKTTKSKVSIVILTLIPFFDLYISIKVAFYDFWLHPDSYPQGIARNLLPHPAHASLLSGSSLGHFAQMLFIWILPIYLMFIYSDYYIQEKKLGYSDILYTKKSRSQFLKDRFSVSFLLGFAVPFLSLTINYLAAILIFRGGKSFSGLEQFPEALHGLALISLQHPYITYAVYILVFSLFSGLFAMLCTSISMLFPQYKLAYPIALLIWYGQIILPNSLTYVFQPFIEYGFKQIIPASILFVTICLAVSIFAFRHQVIADET